MSPQLSEPPSGSGEQAFAPDALDATTSDNAPTTSSSTPSSTSSDTPPNAGAIAGGCIGGVLFIVLIILIVLLIRRRKQQRKAPSANFLAQNPEWDWQRTSTPNSLSYLTVGHRRLDSGNDDSPPPFVPGPHSYPFPEKLPVQPQSQITV
ncbi:hypothetical protein Moror_9061 [Moniliophthora roreri MCA 2997]|uniref:Epidermal growth factor receptor-like transmembrane-juxtamembrane segment domain-containing protein n=2 Tax=Moniliophthora roreri TaxID=221103 RepID=V2XK71_MONRO|nr:hypothetical protein Moror_9061 [Moniliophthora roreri MCA 2997]KAI3607775.1 hypothetical protein WG66_005147 [Moniliophthora roreri]